MQRRLPKLRTDLLGVLIDIVKQLDSRGIRSHLFGVRNYLYAPILHPSFEVFVDGSLPAYGSKNSQRTGIHEDTLALGTKDMIVPVFYEKSPRQITFLEVVHDFRYCHTVVFASLSSNPLGSRSVP